MLKRGSMQKNMQKKVFLLVCAALVVLGLSGCKAGYGGSSDAGLSRLSFDNGALSPDFDNDTYEYTLTLALSEDEFKVNARVSEDDATMQLRELGNLNSKPVTKTYDLTDDTDSTAISVEVGTHYYDILVTSGNGSEKAYDFTITREATESSDATFATLEAENMDISFNSNETEYDTNVNFFVNSTRFKATVNESGARIDSFSGSGDASSDSFTSRQDLEVGANSFSWGVIASDRTSKETYEVNVTRAASDDAIYHMLKAADADDNHMFGSSVAMSGNYIVVGAPKTDFNGTDSGSVYFFLPSADSWAQSVRIDGPAGEEFGFSVAISGDLAVIGAPEAENGEGRVYVFRRDGTEWKDAGDLQASDKANGQRFGFNVAVSADGDTSGDYIAVANEGLANIGKVYVYSDSNWNKEQIIESDQPAAGNQMGASLAFNSTDLLIGAPGEAGTNSEVNAGSVYVFALQSGDLWEKQQVVLASDMEADAAFGKSVDALNNSLVIGASGADSHGQAYIFTRDSVEDDFTQQSILSPESSQAMAFGSSVAMISESMVAVGAPSENEEAIGIDSSPTGTTLADAGAVFVFGYVTNGDSSTVGWFEDAYVKAELNTSAGDMFGKAIASEGTKLVIGAPNEDTALGTGSSPNDSGNDVGAVYLIE